MNLLSTVRLLWKLQYCIMQSARIFVLEYIMQHYAAYLTNLLSIELSFYAFSYVHHLSATHAARGFHWIYNST